MKLEYIKDNLTKSGVIFEAGLSDVEITDLESEYNFSFPPDLKEFLQFSLPVSEGWVNWREPNKENVSERLSWPYEGICFDIEHNNLWLSSWGTKPSNITEAFNSIKVMLSNSPKLIPIYSHRYIPDTPCERNNPILSVYQTDIIYYGRDLQDYLENEFHFGKKTNIEETYNNIKSIEFWGQFVE